MRALEEEFKGVIVKRGRNYAGLTPDGERVLGVLSRLKGQRSAIVVTHRPEVAAVADRVVTIAEA